MVQKRLKYNIGYLTKTNLLFQFYFPVNMHLFQLEACVRYLNRCISPMYILYQLHEKKA